MKGISMGTAKKVWIGGSEGKMVAQSGKMSNRHGIIAGATGTGKTVTLQTLIEGFSKMGVPVFAADIKGDLSGLAAAGSANPKVDERISQLELKNYHYSAYPTVFWDVYGKTGHPVRSTISEMGPLLLANLMNLNDTQTSILYAAFDLADDEGLLLLDLKDLRSMITWMGKNGKELKEEYGNISSPSIGAIQRQLLVLEEQGADHFFGEPAIRLEDFMHTDFSGNGVINLLDATKLVSQGPKLYTTFLLWLLSELFEQLPETGDPEAPKLVLFFDEAHLLFDQAPKVLVDKIEQVVRLIRSKGVGLYFITQSPTDIPEDILGQLGLRIQHTLRAFTPKDKKVVKAVAESFRANPDFDSAEAITQLEIGEALVSVLDQEGSPTPVMRTLIRPPESRIGPLKDQERQECLDRSPIKGTYDSVLDRESAFEILKKRADKIREEEHANDQASSSSHPSSRKRGRKRQGVGEAFFKSAVRSIGSQLGRQIIRGLLGSIMGKRR